MTRVILIYIRLFQKHVTCFSNFISKIKKLINIRLCRFTLFKQDATRCKLIFNQEAFRASDLTLTGSSIHAMIHFTLIFGGNRVTDERRFTLSNWIGENIIRLLDKLKESEIMPSFNNTPKQLNYIIIYFCNFYIV